MLMVLPSLQEPSRNSYVLEAYKLMSFAQNEAVNWILLQKITLQY